MTCLSAVVRGSRLNCWKTKPMVRLRSRARSSADMRPMSRPSIARLPLVGVSSPPIRFIMVDLPDPEAPMIATNSPASMSSETPSRALSSCSPIR